jgi:hypothetical protein
MLIESLLINALACQVCNGRIPERHPEARKASAYCGKLIVAKSAHAVGRPCTRTYSEDVRAAVPKMAFKSSSVKVTPPPKK